MTWWNGVVWKLVASLGLSVTTVAASAALGAESEETPGIVRLARHERSLDTTGSLRDVDVDSAQVHIADAAPLGSITERPAAVIRHRPLPRRGILDGETLKREVEHHFGDLELCRARVVSAAGLPVSEVTAGSIELHWTILPSGRTRDTLVLERSDTALAVMKCARRRMNAWRFTPSRGGPAPVEYQYTFSQAAAYQGGPSATSPMRP